MPNLDPEQRQQAMAAAIEGTLGTEMVTRWVAVVETLDSNGDRSLWMHADPDQKPWDTLGLLRYADLYERAQLAGDLADSEDEDTN